MEQSNRAWNRQAYYRFQHPKIRYNTAKEAAKELQELKRRNRGTHYESSSNRLNVYYDGDDRCYYIGHNPR